MSMFAVLADDVEEADDFKPVVPATSAAAPVPKEVPAKVTTSAPTSHSNKSQDERRNSGRSGYRGRGGGRGGRGRGRGGRGRGHRSFNRDRERERDPDGWERPPRPAAAATATPPPQPGTTEANGHNPMSTPAVAGANESEPKTDANGDASTEAQPEAKAVAVEEKSMGLAEYLAQKKSASAGVGLKKGDVPTRKANDFGGKMAPLRKQNDAAETSIFSAVAIKSETESRAAAAAAAAAGATNPLNIIDDATQQFFRSQPRRGRGRGRGGYRGDDRHGNGNSYGRRTGSNAPNVDDTNAFPALSA